MLFFYALKAISSPLACSPNALTFGVGVGYEDIRGLISDQKNNVLTRISVSKEIFMMDATQSIKMHTGFEIAARNGFTGALDISDEIQEEITGPTPIALSSPEVELLGTARASVGRKAPYVLTKFGVSLSVLKFDRADLTSSKISNLIGFIGLGFQLTDSSDIHLLVTGSRPLSKLRLDGLYTIYNPYTQKAFLVEFYKVF
ncbi:MAG: hypothetical protein P1U32_08565 [Legionellaceae bacterium]|nr:hypothetical protein [Legionellaceae bacterium]